MKATCLSAARNRKGQFSDETVRLNTGAGLLRIDGEMLELRELSEERLFICGAITSVSYEYKEGRMQRKK